MFTVIPAIDLKDGRCVRLRQGRAEQAKVYSEDPVEMALHWASEGAAFLHVVDLDGAFQGEPVHTDVIAAIVRALSIPVEVGGGLRTNGDIRRLLGVGVARAIIGTRAFADPKSLGGLVAEFGPRLAVGIDSRDGKVQIRGWVTVTATLAVDLAKQADAMGVRTLICTDTATDGMLTGVNARAVADICDAVTCDVIASGGVVSAEDIRTLCGLRNPNLTGAIVGKALYEGRVTLKQLQDCAAASDASLPT